MQWNTCSSNTQRNKKLLFPRCIQNILCSTVKLTFVSQLALLSVPVINTVMYNTAIYYTCLLTQVHMFITQRIVSKPYLNRTNLIFTPYYKRSYGTLRKLFLTHTVHYAMMMSCMPPPPPPPPPQVQTKYQQPTSDHSRLYYQRSRLFQRPTLLATPTFSSDLHGNSEDESHPDVKGLETETTPTLQAPDKGQP